MQWTQQNIIFWATASAFAVIISAVFLRYFSDFAVEAWRTNNRNKKWVVCFLVAIFYVLKCLKIVLPS